VRGGLFGSLIALLLAGNLALAQAPPPGGPTNPAEPTLPPPQQLLDPGPASSSLPPPSQLPLAGTPEGGAVAAGCEPFPGLAWRLCGPPGRFYAGAEYLLWWTKGQQLPPLVTTGSLSDSVPGALGQPNTVELIGNNTVDDQVRSGGRFFAGLWINDAQTIGIEGGVFFLQPRSTQLTAYSNGLGLLARPFYEVGTVTAPDGTTQELAQEDALLVGSPGTSFGNVRVSTSNLFWGAEANGRVNLCGDCFYRIDLLAGFRYLELKDSLGIVSISDTIPPVGPTTVIDTFNTINHFYGGQVGLVVAFCRGCWFLDFRGKLALGAISRVADINGLTTFLAGGGPPVIPGGLFAQPTNSGHHTNTAFSVVPELGVRAGCQITSYLRAYLGYSVIYLAKNVAQPGNQIDRAVNVNQIPALGQLAPLTSDFRPAFTFLNTDFWAQGFSFGLEVNF
jgi:hypothetical protein